MSEAEDQRPLSRRERRIKEFGETGALPLLNADGTSVITNPPTVDEDIYVDPLDENGEPRSRREIRELREKIRQERAAANGEETSAAPDVAGDVSADTQSVHIPEASELAEEPAPTEQDESELAEEPAPETTDEPTEQVDSELHADTDLAVVPEPEAPSFDDIFNVDPDHTQPRVFTELPIDLEGEEEPAAESEQTIAVAEETSVDTSENTAEDALDSVATEDESVPDTAAVEIVTTTELEVAADSAIIEEAVAVEAPVQAKRSTYTFPDITPLDDEVSVFDDPAIRTISASGTAQPAFDDLISRAVAQEGAASTTNTSALILPSMPETDGISGPIGETGELFITGSIDLPRSFSETGGHASLIDSVEDDRFVELGAADQDPRDSGILPVSATRAVSARVIPGPVVTEAQKEKSKLPVVLISTGGGLVVVVAGLLIWGATSGMFG